MKTKFNKGDLVAYLHSQRRELGIVVGHTKWGVLWGCGVRWPNGETFWEHEYNFIVMERARNENVQ